MKEYLSDLKFTLGILFIIFIIIIYNSSYFLSDQTISQVKIIESTIVEGEGK
ncbi:MAG: hypothetical protein K8R39_11895 [Arcobacteraceae bacterium]|nr:hypothetical protein [Arcobacteraceae bacterium]